MYAMHKHALVAFALLLVWLTPTNCYLEQAIAAADGCLGDLGLDASELKDLVQKMDNLLEPTHDGKCLVACSMQAAGFMKDYKYNEDAIMKSLPGTASVKFDNCQDIMDTDDCDRYFKMSVCVTKQISINE